jgi:hypothetical protein
MNAVNCTMISIRWDMRNVAKLRPNEKRVQLSFTRPEDLKLHAWMEKRAYECRYDLATFIVVGLHEAFDHQLPIDEPTPTRPDVAPFILPEHVPTHELKSAMVDPETPAPTPPVLTDEQLARQAEAEIAQLDAIAAAAMGKRKRTGKIPLPPPV